jgi:hypothetical protein
LKAGDYVITPEATSGSNYTIVADTGILHVNPYGSNIKAVKPGLECVQDLGGGIYSANYNWTNDNTVAVWVPRGIPDNYIDAESNVVKDGNLTPQKFAGNSTGRFSVKFDGSKTISWVLASTLKTQKTSQASLAGSNSNKCGSPYSTPAPILTSRKSTSGMEMTGVDKVYPNPFSTRVVIETDLTGVTNKDIKVFDMTGREYQPVSTRMVSVKKAELDLSNLITGQYYIRVTTKSGSKVFRVQRQ